MRDSFSEIRYRRICLSSFFLEKRKNCLKEYKLFIETSYLPRMKRFINEFLSMMNMSAKYCLIFFKDWQIRNAYLHTKSWYAFSFYMLPHRDTSFTIKKTSDICNISINHKDSSNWIRAIKLIRRQQGGIVEITDRSDIPVPTDKHQIHFALAVFKQTALMVATDIANLDSSVQSPDRHLLIGDKPEQPIIVGLCPQRAKNALRFLIELVGIGHFGNTAHGYLRSKVKAFSRFLIHQFVQIKLPEHFCSPCLLRNPVTSRIASLQRLLEQIRLFGRRLQFDVSDKFHNSIIETLLALVNPQRLTAPCAVRYPSPP